MIDFGFLARFEDRRRLHAAGRLWVALAREHGLTRVVGDRLQPTDDNLRI